MEEGDGKDEGMMNVMAGWMGEEEAEEDLNMEGRPEATRNLVGEEAGVH